MPSFTELSTELGKTLDLLSDKKKILDDLTTKIQAANDDYLNAVNYAQDIKSKMQGLLDNLIPSTTGGSRIRA